MDGTTPKYYYFLKDHQGNNRMVIDQAGTVEQVNHYYPFGGLFGEGVQASNQPYMYNGKEFDHLFGLNKFAVGSITNYLGYAPAYYVYQPGKNNVVMFDNTTQALERFTWDSFYSPATVIAPKLRATPHIFYPGVGLPPP